MCLAEPLRVVETDGKMATVEIEGVRSRVDASLLKGLRRGDYILVHDKLAVQKLEREDARETLLLIKELEV